VIQTSQASFERWRIEVHEEPGRTSREPEVRDHLREMNRMKTFDGLQLHDDAAVDDQVQFEPAADLLPL
jgi:hypothetical protein